MNDQNVIEKSLRIIGTLPDGVIDIGEAALLLGASISRIKTLSLTVRI